MRWVCAGPVATRPNAPATVERSQPPVLPAWPVVNNLLTLPLPNGWSWSRPCGTRSLPSRTALSSLTPIGS